MPIVSVGLLPRWSCPVETRDYESVRFWVSRVQNSPMWPLQSPREREKVDKSHVAQFSIWWPQHQAAKRKAEWTLHADQEIVVVCEHGGSLQSKTGAETGFQSQSLKAAYYLKKAGYTKVMHMKVL